MDNNRAGESNYGAARGSVTIRDTIRDLKYVHYVFSFRASFVVRLTGHNLQFLGDVWKIKTE